MASTSIINNKTQDSNLAQKYQKKTDKQHVLDTPDTYTGSMTTTDYDTFVFVDNAKSNSTDDNTSSNDNNNDKIVEKQVSIVPGLYKIFDEAVVNTRDQTIRMRDLIDKGNADAIPVTEIDISIDMQTGIITLRNNGNGIDIAKHPVENIWIPELIFAHLRTSTNYDKTEKKTTGGKNGFGIKLAFIWSTWARIETVDHIRKLKYIQEFENNLDIIKTPSVEKFTQKPFTKVSFKPDYKRMGLNGLTDDLLALFKRRVFDLAAVTEKSVKVKYNNELVPIKSFLHYVDYYVGDKTTTARIHEEANERWEYVVCMAPKEEFTQVSFVNGIFTSKGGKHVEYILNQFVRKMTAYIKQKKKVDVKPNTIKEQLFFFVRCVIENPSFDSQTKDYMNTPSSSFGSSCEISDKFIEKAAKLGIMDAACALTEVKTTKTIKKQDGVKSKSVRGIPKLVDANDAGGPNSSKCVLILCEGDSAKAGIMSGLSTTDRNTIGVYPLRGKLFNVRGETAKRISEVKEIHEIKQIVGLQAGKKYTIEEATQHLRYGKVLFMTDQDLDGSHIKGLCINLFDAEWNTLLSIPGFIGFMNTPIIKARKGNQERMFYNDGEYEKWKKESVENNTLKGWTFKYYKGLGTSTGKEFKEYFANKKIVNFVSTGEGSSDAIDKVFNKKRAADRKEWLENYDRNLYLDTNRDSVPYEDFIGQEMIHFSKYDCERSIPNGIDGLKTSQRKILFTCLERRLTHEVKVAQLGGAVSEKSRYHHGEQSLYGAIINMAQDFVGSNNINLLEPNGQFGTRLQGGDDAASERYICTQLSKLTRLIFPEADDSILTYLEDDGTPVEPMFYVPIIPMQLVNGGKGIGTGFSTDILNYNPLTVIDYVKQQLLEKQNKELSKELSTALPELLSSSTLTPHYNGFNGTITSLNEQNNKYLIKGVYEILSDKQVRVTELPIGTWTDDYKKYIEELIDFKPVVQSSSQEKEKKEKVDKKEKEKEKDKKEKDKKEKPSKKSKSDQPQIKDYIDMSTDTTVDFTITFANGVISDLKDTIVEHNTCSALEKLLKLYTTRTTTNMHVFDENEKLIKCEKVEDVIMHFMKVREAYYIKRKNYQVDSLKKETCILSNKARFISEVLDDTIDLRKKKSAEVSAIMKLNNYDMVDEDEHYKYLVRLPMDSVTEENIEKIMSERDRKNKELEILLNTSEREIWLKELDTLRTEYLKIREKVQPEAKITTTKIHSSSSNLKAKAKATKKSVKNN
jgi:DNA topoisomerase-2